MGAYDFIRRSVKDTLWREELAITACGIRCCCHVRCVVVVDVKTGDEVALVCPWDMAIIV